MSMFTDPSRPHQVFPLLKAKAKETEWLCRALTFVLPQLSGQADQCHRHISRVLALLLEFYVSAGRVGLFHPPADIDHCAEHAGTVHLVVSMSRDHRRQAMQNCV